MPAEKIANIAINAANIKLLFICEAPPEIHSNDFYGDAESLYNKNTILLFEKAGEVIHQTRSLPPKGIHIINAMQEIRPEAGFKARQIAAGSFELEKELDRYTALKAIMLMGDTAIKCLNNISRRRYRINAIPAGSTYK